MDGDRSDNRRVRRWAAGIAVVVAAVAAGWWAGQVTLMAPPVSETADEQVLVSVTEATVGQSLRLNVTVSQPFTLVASNALPGVVTSVGGPVLAAGDAAYSVADRPVRAVQGLMPFYRDLSEGLKGTDVTQLQNALVTLGYLGRADGNFGGPTTRAVRAWQKVVGVEPSGEILLGELFAVPTLPTAVQLGEDVRVGAVLAGGEQAIFARSSPPTFALVVSSDQATSIPADAAVNIEFDGGVWPAVISATEAGENGEIAFSLTAADGSVVCGARCGSLPPDETVSLLSQVQLVPEASGAGIPVAAIQTAADGSTYLYTESGEQIRVEVIASGDGIAIITGAEIGDRVLASGSPPDEESIDGRSADD